MLGAPGPDFGTWESTVLNRNAQNHAVKDLIASRNPFSAIVSGLNFSAK
jgi:hypothetical protein